MFLLDTNVISELRRQRPHGGVLAWIASAEMERLFVSSVTAGEIQQGAEATRKHDPDKAAEIELWLERALIRFRFLSMDARCFCDWARLMVGKPKEHALDGMIASVARVNGLTVVTRNVRDFKRFKVATLNPFEYRAP